MRGRVKWCKPVSFSSKDVSEEENNQYTFEVGVRLISVNEESVAKSIHHDKTYDVDWSIVLEAVFGNYQMLMDGRHKNSDDQKQRE